ncbi:hypothetical protein Tco_1502871 [Tanacetum coccineum]
MIKDRYTCRHTGNNKPSYFKVTKDIYSLINHYTDAKEHIGQCEYAFWKDQDNKGKTICYNALKLNKALKDSKLDQQYAYLKQHEAHANENKIMLKCLTQQTVDPLALIRVVLFQNVQGRQNRGQGNNARGASAVGYGRAQNRVGNANPGQARQVKCYNYNGVATSKMNYTPLKHLQTELRIHQRQDVTDARSREWGES